MSSGQSNEEASFDPGKGSEPLQGINNTQPHDIELTPRHATAVKTPSSSGFPQSESHRSESPQSQSESPQSESHPPSITPSTQPAIVNLANLAKSNSSEELPRVTVAYKDIAVKVRVNAVNEIETVITPTINFFKHAFTCYKNKYKDFIRINTTSGVIKPGSMTLVLSPPGHGKSSFLKALSSRIELSQGTLYFNGRTPLEAEKEGINVRKLTQYIDQVDLHLPLLTVYETLNFAHKVSSCFYDENRVNSVIEMLGLEECRDTIIGSASIRGISGGQRRRVSIGEMLVGDARAIFLDEFSNGLDTATAEDIGVGLRDWVRSSQGSVIATLQQPTPGMLKLFDNVVLIRDGNVVYQGPCDDILPYLASMGFKCPSDVDICDFIIDCLSQPRVTVELQSIEEKRLEKFQKMKNLNNISSSKESSIPSNSPNSPNSPTSLKSCLGFDISPSITPCITTESMLQHFKNSQYWKIVEKEIEDIFSPDKSNSIKQQPIAENERSRAIYKVGYALSYPELFLLLFRRQWNLNNRDRVMFISRILQATVVGLLFGSIFYQTDDTNYFARANVMLNCISELSVISMIELPLAVQSNLIVYKQVSSRFFPSWMYVLSNTFVTTPAILVPTLIFGSLVYFLNGAVLNAANYLIFIAVLFVLSVCLGVWFRMLSILSDDESVAYSIAGPSFGFFLTFGGIFIQPSVIPDWLIWVYWLSPFSWALRAVVNNEYLHPKYDTVTNNGLRIGDVFINQMEMLIGHEWIVYGILQMIGLSIILIVFNAWGLHRPYHELSIGTRRFDEEEATLLDNGDEEENDMDIDNDVDINTDINTDNNTENDITTNNNHDNHNNNDNDIDESTTYQTKDSVLHTLRYKLKTTPTWLSFRDISYTVEVVKDKIKSDRILLQNINGYAEPGKLTALMGASGAGKTTLLDVLAGRAHSGIVQGSIKLNGHSLSKSEMSAATAYVEQFDSLLPYDTVRETLTFAARLRLPSDVSDDIKLSVVDEVLEILELTSIQDMIIGNSRIPGLSPSQLKRVNIGVELVANPAIIFLDEPTTGLDSRSAQTVMRVVRRIARSGRSIICTIHQPSAELFYLFDRLVLLASGGYQMYFGDLGHRSKTLIKYLSAIEGIQPIPPRYNPASWMLEELGVGVQSVKKAAAEAEGREYEAVEDKILRLQSIYFESSMYDFYSKKLVSLDTLDLQDSNKNNNTHQLDQDEDQDENKHTQDTQDTHDISVNTSANSLKRQISFSAYSKSTVLPEYSPTFQPNTSSSHTLQFIEVVSRHMRMYWRSPSYMFSRFSVIFLIAFIFGFIYYNIQVVNQATAMSFVAALIFTSTPGGYTFGSTALSKMMDDRITFYRERNSGFYKGYYWLIASLSAEIPCVILAAIIGQIACYFLINLSLDADKFFLYTMALFMQLFVYICHALFFSAVSPAALGQLFFSVTYSLTFAFMGVTIPLPQIPAGYKWLFQMLPLSHISSMTIMPQLETCDDLPRCGPIIDVLLVGSTEMQSMHLSEYLSEYLGWPFHNFWVDFGYVWIYCGTILMISLIAIQFCDYSKK